MDETDAIACLVCVHSCLNWMWIPDNGRYHWTTCTRLYSHLPIASLAWLWSQVWLYNLSVLTQISENCSYKSQICWGGHLSRCGQDTIIALWHEMVGGMRWLDPFHPGQPQPQALGTSMGTAINWGQARPECGPLVGPGLVGSMMVNSWRPYVL